MVLYYIRLNDILLYNKTLIIFCVVAGPMLALSHAGPPSFLISLPVFNVCEKLGGPEDEARSMWRE